MRRRVRQRVSRAQALSVAWHSEHARDHAALRAEVVRGFA